MRKSNVLRQMSIISLLIVTMMLSACGLPHKYSGIKPIEPIVPGSESGQEQTVQGQFTVKNNDIDYLDVSVTANGSLTAVGTARSVYLLERDGKLLWERTLNSKPLHTRIDPGGRFLAVGTSGGKLLVLNPESPDQQAIIDYQFDAPVNKVSLSADGELVLVGLNPEDPEKSDTLVLLHKSERILWEEPLAEILDVQITGADNQIYVNWQKNGKPFISAYSDTGEKLWELQDRSHMTLSGDGSILIGIRGNEVLQYNKDGEEEWGYTAPGTVSRVLIAESGLYYGALVTDTATQNQELFYFNAAGELLWSKRLPNDSDLILSSNGQRVLVASWRQYRDDATQVFIYNENGQEINVLEVAGRAQSMALADRAGFLALGLEDGNIYFLNVSEPVVPEPTEVVQNRGLLNYYSPVTFYREEGESLMQLYFYDEAAETLVPVTRSIKKTQSVLRASIEELVRGPMQGSNLNRTIPKDAVIQVSYSEGAVTLDLPPALDEMGGTTFLSGVLNSLFLTVSQFPTVEQIKFTVGGEKKATFGQEGLVIEEAYQPRPYGQKAGERLLFIPGRSGSRYYLQTKSEAFLSVKDTALIETLVRQVIKESQPLFRETLELQSVRIDSNIVYLDFTDSFNRIVVQTAEAAARAAILRDALALTIMENAYYSSIKITVNGKPPLKPAIYLPWEIIISRPYHVNPEN
jgi:spore germination protein GerM